MNTIFAWFLVSSFHGGGVAYSPPFATLDECVRVQKIVSEQDRSLYYPSGRCIQMQIVKH